MNLKKRVAVFFMRRARGEDTNDTPILAERPRFPADFVNVALEYHDVWIGKTELLIAHRQLGRWIDNRSGVALRENGRTMFAERWWDLTPINAISCFKGSDS